MLTLNLANSIAQFVCDNKIPQKQLAKKAGMSESALSLTLNGNRKLLADEYIKICDALCLPYDKFADDLTNKAS